GNLLDSVLVRGAADGIWQASLRGGRRARGGSSGRSAHITSELRVLCHLLGYRRGGWSAGTDAVICWISGSWGHTAADYHHRGRIRRGGAVRRRRFGASGSGWCAGGRLSLRILCQCSSGWLRCVVRV